MPTKRTTLADVPADADETPDEVAAVLALELAARPFNPPTNVVQALANVEAAVGGVPKLTTAQRRELGMTTADGEAGVKWAYRGVDQMTAAAQRLLGLNGVIIVGSVNRATADVTTVTLTNNGKQTQWLHVTCDVVITVYGPGGVEDRLPEFIVTGEARDNSDKVWAKVQTSGRKNALLDLLKIGDPKNDPDHETHPNDERDNAEPPHPAAGIDAMLEAAAGPEGEVNDRTLKALRASLRNLVGNPFEVPVAEFSRVALAAQTILAKLNALAGENPTDEERFEAAKAVYQGITDAVETTAAPDAEVEPPAAPTEDEAVRDALDEAWAQAQDIAEGGPAPTREEVLPRAAAILLGVFPGTMNETYALEAVRIEQDRQDAEDAAALAAEGDA